MSVCPRCGTNANNQIKTWSMVDRPNKTGEQIKLTVGFFMCHECEKRFMNVIEKEKEDRNLKGVLGQIKGIEKGLTKMLGDLREKIERLKNERSELLEEIEELRRTGELKLNNLEEEVSSLREEVDSLKEMLGESE